MRLLATLLVLFAFCCSGARMSADARVRSALELLAVVVDPAYRLAVDNCIARETLVVERAEARVLAVDEADRQLAAIREGCHRRRRIFESIRELHDEASRQVESGFVEDAEKTLERLRAEWTRLKGDPT